MSSPPHGGESTRAHESGLTFLVQFPARRDRFVACPKLSSPPLPMTRPLRVTFMLTRDLLRSHGGGKQYCCTCGTADELDAMARCSGSWREYGASNQLSFIEDLAWKCYCVDDRYRGIVVAELAEACGIFFRLEMN